jgi:hypothetical protein
VVHVKQFTDSAGDAAQKQDMMSQVRDAVDQLNTIGASFAQGGQGRDEQRQLVAMGNRSATPSPRSASAA